MTLFSAGDMEQGGLPAGSDSSRDLGGRCHGNASHPDDPQRAAG